MVEDRISSSVGEFIARNLKVIATAIIFCVGIYLEHQISMVRVERMETEIEVLKSQQESQYVKLDNMKLDKVVFEATMRQFSEMTTDIRQIRDRLEDILSSQSGNSHAK